MIRRARTTRTRGLLIPVVSGILSLLLLLGMSVGTNVILTEQNDRSQQKTEQVAIAAAVRQEKAQEAVTIALAIEANNQNLCDVIVTTNKAASQLTSAEKAILTPYQKRILRDYKALAVKFKCGS